MDLLGQAVVKIVGDHSTLISQLKEVEKQSEKSGNIAGRLFSKGLRIGVASVAGAALGASAFAGYSIHAAAAAQEAQSKFEAVFQHLGDQATAFADNLGREAGRGIGDIKQQMSGFQDLFVPLGFAREKSLELSKSLVKLSVDLGSFHDIADADAGSRIQSALVGNHEAVRRFGIVITEASLKQELFRMGINKSYNSVSNLEKVQARLNLIMKGSGDAIGDAARTADSFTNVAKAVAGTFQDMTVEIGQLFLPAATAFNVAIRDMIAKVREFTPILTRWGKIIGEIASNTLGHAGNLLDEVTDRVIEFSNAAANTVGLESFEDGITGVLNALELLTRDPAMTWELFTNSFDGAIASIKVGLLSVAKEALDAYITIPQHMGDLLAAVGASMPNMFDVLGKGIAQLIDGIDTAIDAMVAKLKSEIAEMTKMITNPVQYAVEQAKKLASAGDGNETIASTKDKFMEVAGDFSTGSVQKALTKWTEGLQILTKPLSTGIDSQIERAKMDQWIAKDNIERTILSMGIFNSDPDIKKKSEFNFGGLAAALGGDALNFGKSLFGDLAGGFGKFLAGAGDSDLNRWKSLAANQDRIFAGGETGQRVQNIGFADFASRLQSSLGGEDKDTKMQREIAENTKKATKLAEKQLGQLTSAVGILASRLGLDSA